MDLKNKVVVITGAGRGLGRGMALAFAAKGANVAVVDLNEDDINQTVALCKEQGEVQHAHPGIAEALADEEGQQGQCHADQDHAQQGFAPVSDHARSATFSPISPEGRKTSTRISTKKANTSW